MKTIKKLSGVLFSLTLCLGFGVSLSSKAELSQVEAAGNYTQTVNDYYSGFDWDKTGSALKSALFDKIKISKAGWSYDGLWDAYKTTDVRPDGQHYWDIYSDKTMYTLNDSRINAEYKKEHDSINREHVIPQGSFNKKAPMVSDIHHVLPSDGYVNNRRGSYPHGEVTSAEYTSEDGCLLGTGTGTGRCFEPKDCYKGDIARIYFYFVTCYEDKLSSNTFAAFDKTTFPSIKSEYLSVYLRWAKEDPVSQKEIDRNNAAYKGQGNRNPFIDCPYAVGAIWDTTHASDYGTKGQYTSGTPSTGVTISTTSLSIVRGNTAKISATSSDSSSITWSTSNSSVVSISSTSASSGSQITLTGVSNGTATITAKATISGTQYTKTCSVTVTNPKTLSSISVSGQKTTFNVNDSFSFGGTVTANYSDSTTANVTTSATFSGYNLSTAGNQTVTVSYTEGGTTKTTTYSITVSEATGLDQYTISSTPLTSSGITNGMKVVWGTSSSNLAYTIESDWVKLTTDLDNVIIFTIEGTSSGFKLHADDGYVYSSTKKKVSFSATDSTTMTLTSSGIVNGGSSVGDYVFNSTGLRPYTSGSYTSAYLYALTSKTVAKTLVDIDFLTEPDKMSYFVGDYFDPSGMAITRHFSDNSSDSYTYNGHESEFSFEPSLDEELTIDDEYIKVMMGEEYFYLEISVNYPFFLDSIAVQNQREFFQEGDEFVFGGSVVATYTDNTGDVVTEDATFSGYDMYTIGEQTVTVSYTEGDITKTDTYTITVDPATLSSITVSDQTTEFTKGDTFVFDGTVTANFTNGYSKEIGVGTVSSPNMSICGTQSVTVSASYNGLTKETSYDIFVATGRTVTEEGDTVEGTITWPTSLTANIDTDITSLVASNGGAVYYESGDKAIRLGTGSGGGSITISSSSPIVSLTITAKYYNSNYTSSVLLGDGESVGQLTASFEEYDITLDEATAQFTLSTADKYNRVTIKSVVVHSGSVTGGNISRTDDAVGLENFITEYMHMDYTQNLGYCKDNEHHYYASAKAAFNLLNEHQRELFTTNEAYAAEWARLQAWASINGDELSSDNILEVNDMIKGFSVNEDNSTVLMVIILAVGVVSLGGFFLLKRKKEN